MAEPLPPQPQPLPIPMPPPPMMPGFLGVEDEKDDTPKGPKDDDFYAHWDRFVKHSKGKKKPVKHIDAPVSLDTDVGM